MNRFIYLFIVAIIIGCGAKRTQSQLASGNYDEAIEIAVDNLRNNKDKEGKQKFIYMLEEAFAKAKERDLREIDMLSKESNPAKIDKIYKTYQLLNDRQEEIRPLLPLKLIKENRDAIFPFDNYSDEIVSSKAALSKYLYDNSIKVLKSASKSDARNVYDDLKYLNQINPNYKDVKKLIDEAQFKGTDFVNVRAENETNMIIPARLEYDLLDFSTYGLNDKWTEYHSELQKGINYDYAVVINFRTINISPEQINQREFEAAREVNLGKKKLLDRLGNVVMDAQNNPIMVDNIRTLRAKVNEFKQFKACQVTAKVDYVNLKSDQLMQSFPLVSEFIFENIHAKYQGDRRAVEDNYQQYFDNRPMPFPTAEQMVYDAGEDLKAKLKNIISRNRL